MKRSNLIRNLVATSLAVGLGFGAVGCKPSDEALAGHGHSHGPGADPHGDEHEEPTFALTAWENGFELFAEHEAAETGKSAEFIVHVSELKTGKPRTAGALTLTLTAAGGESVTATVDKPARPGIYLPTLKMPGVGILALKASFTHNGAPVAVNLGAVTIFADHDAAHHGAEKIEEVEGISFLKEQQWRSPTLTATVGKRSLTERLTVPGEVHARSGDRAAVVAPVSGRLLTVGDGPFPLVGQRVKRGEKLARVQPVFSEIGARLVEARAAVERAAVELEDAKKTHARIRGLAEQEAKSQRELQDAETALRLAESAHQAARRLEIAYTSASAGMLEGAADAAPSITLTSPIAGGVTRHLDKARGEFIQEGETLFTVLNSESVYLHGKIPESRAIGLKMVTGALCEVGGPDGERFVALGEGVGKLLSIGRGVDHETRTVAIHIETPNPDGRLRIGQRVSLALATGEAREALAIPESAIVEEDGVFMVYAQVAGETFQKRPVKIGIRDGEWAEVLEGVTAGDRVVVQGAYSVRLASLGGGAIPHSHH